MYVNIETKEVISREELESRFLDPIVGFPADVSNEVLSEFGYANLEYDERPETNSSYQQISSGPVREESGHYYQTWVVNQLGLAEAKSNALNKLNTEFTAAMALLQTGWPDYEVKTWDIQSEEARQWSSAPDDDKPATPFLTALFDQRTLLGWEEPFADLVGRIMTNTYNYTMATATCIAIRHVAERAINTSDDPSKVTWNFNLQ